MKTLQRKETEMKILHGKDANRSHKKESINFLLINRFQIAKLEHVHDIIMLRPVTSPDG